MLAVVVVDGLGRDHRLQGIFAILGPDIKRGNRIRGARIYDLAPTILHFFGIPIPQDMDGRVLYQTFSEGSELAKREIAYQGTDERTSLSGKVKDLKDIDKI